jgi:NAD(P)-dependent dehydrogenase (short-subunit alcohol dehydrogenase family)
MAKEQGRMTGKVALISGGAEGIGGTVARMIVAEGGSVMLGDLQLDKAKALAAELGPNADAVVLDVRDLAQWDAAVEANAAELRVLREDAARAAEAQNAQGSKLVELKGAFEAKVIAMDTLTKKRRGLAAEEEALRRRYVQLRERRLAKQAGKPPPLPVSLDVDDVAEAVGANVEKAAVAFFRLFGKEKEGNPQLPPGKDDF